MPNTNGQRPTANGEMPMANGQCRINPSQGGSRGSPITGIERIQRIPNAAATPSQWPMPQQQLSLRCSCAAL